MSGKNIREDIMDDRLKELMQDLGNAINESLSDSDRIAEAIGEIKRAGYDVFLILEATIGFNKREEYGEEEETQTNQPQQPEPSKNRPSWTTQDIKFLRALRISLNGEEKDPPHSGPSPGTPRQPRRP